MEKQISFWPNSMAKNFFFFFLKRVRLSHYGQWRYLSHVDNRFFVTVIHGIDMNDIWFQQDGTTCHTCHATIDLLRQTFDGSLVSRNDDDSFPPRKLFFFFGASLKKIVVPTSQRQFCILMPLPRYDSIHLKKCMNIGSIEWDIVRPAIFHSIFNRNNCTSQQKKFIWQYIKQFFVIAVV